MKAGAYDGIVVVIIVFHAVVEVYYRGCWAVVMNLVVVPHGHHERA